MQHKDRALKETGLFFILTLGLSYLVFWGPLAAFHISAISFGQGVTGPGWAVALFILGGFVPSFTGLFLTGIRSGKPGMRQLLRRAFQVNIGWRWYLAAIGVTALCTLAQLALIKLLGQSFNLGLFVAQLGSFVPLLILGPLSEELGWRGYALDRLQTRWNALTASLMVGIGWALWHLPLFLIPGTSQHELHIPFLGFACGLVALSVLFTWLQNNTGGSVWTAVFFHWIYTYAAQVVATGVTRSSLYNWLEYLPFVLVALVVVAVWGPKRLRMGVKPVDQSVADEMAG